MKATNVQNKQPRQLPHPLPTTFINRSAKMPNILPATPKIQIMINKPIKSKIIQIISISKISLYCLTIKAAQDLYTTGLESRLPTSCFCKLSTAGSIFIYKLFSTTTSSFLLRIIIVTVNAIHKGF